MNNTPSTSSRRPVKQPRPDPTVDTHGIKTIDADFSKLTVKEQQEFFDMAANQFAELFHTNKRK